MEHKCADVAKVQTERLLAAKKNQESERGENDHTRKIEGLSRKLEELDDRIADAEEEISTNMKGSLRVMCKEFERYCMVRDGNGEV